MVRKKDPFKILGISPQLTLEELEKAYHNLEFLNHPDNFSTPEEKEKAEERLMEIDEAYLEAKEILANRKRGIFDVLLGKDDSDKEAQEVEIGEVKGGVELLKSVLCRRIGKRFYFFGGKVPRSVTNTFTEDDEFVYLYLKLRNKDRSFFDLRVEWISPFMEVYQYIFNQFEQISSTMIFYCWLDLFNVFKDNLEGNWRVKVYLNKKEVSEIPFYIQK